MKIITKMTGLKLLEEITNNNISCGTMIRHKRDDLILTSNPPRPIYEYYKYTAGDKRFHRCDENGKLGAKGQQRFMNYGTLNKEFEIIEEDEDIEELKIEQDGNTYYIKNEYGTKCYLTKHSYLIADKVNELIDEVNRLKGKSN